jgi:hypothetical protein
MPRVSIGLNPRHPSNRGVAFPVDPGLALQPSVQFVACRACLGVGPHLPYPVIALDCAVLLGLGWRYPGDAHSQPDQPQGQVWWQARVQPPGMAVVQLDLLRQSPTPENAAKLRSSLAWRDGLPMGWGQGSLASIAPVNWQRGAPFASRSDSRRANLATRAGTGESVDDECWREQRESRQRGRNLKARIDPLREPQNEANPPGDASSRWQISHVHFGFNLRQSS